VKFVVEIEMVLFPWTYISLRIPTGTEMESIFSAVRVQPLPKGGLWFLALLSTMFQ